LTLSFLKALKLRAESRITCAVSEALECRRLLSAGFLCFTATDGVHGREMWKTDGTASGTAMVVG